MAPDVPRVGRRRGGATGLFGPVVEVGRLLGPVASVPMHIELRVPDTLNTRLPARTYDPELEDVRAILADVCEHAEGQVEFLVSGFGQDRWPVDVRIDLMVFTEQLPCALHAVKSGMEADIFFYEQGVERQILLTPGRDDAYLATCISYSCDPFRWDPHPAVEQLDRASLERMLTAVRDNFMSLLRRISPELVEHEWIQSWRAKRWPDEHVLAEQVR